jgi:hypothetical protein
MRLGHLICLKIESLTIFLRERFAHSTIPKHIEPFITHPSSKSRLETVRLTYASDRN